MMGKPKEGTKNGRKKRKPVYKWGKMQTFYKASDLCEDASWSYLSEEALQNMYAQEYPPRAITDAKRRDSIFISRRLKAEFLAEIKGPHCALSTVENNAFVLMNRQELRALHRVIPDIVGHMKAIDMSLEKGDEEEKSAVSLNEGADGEMSNKILQTALTDPSKRLEKCVEFGRIKGHFTADEDGAKFHLSDLKELRTIDLVEEDLLNLRKGVTALCHSLDVIYGLEHDILIRREIEEEENASSS